VTTTESRTATSKYLSGNFAPVEHEIEAFDLPVRGEIPRELTGRLLRIGPNPVTPPDPATYHWFTGTGMVHGVRMRDGKAEWYRNRFVRDDNVAEAKGVPIAPGPRHGMGAGTANTNVIGHADRTFAIVEAGGLPVEPRCSSPTASATTTRSRSWSPTTRISSRRCGSSGGSWGCPSGSPMTSKPCA